MVRKVQKSAEHSKESHYKVLLSLVHIMAICIIQNVSCSFLHAHSIAIPHMYTYTHVHNHTHTHTHVHTRVCTALHCTTLHYTTLHYTIHYTCNYIYTKHSNYYS